MKKLQLGIVGLSEGNGHPYSWSAIFNGYNSDVMANCGFPSIPQYLQQQKFPNACIADVNVTHIWTQDLNLSQHVAAAAYIPNVVKHMEQMISEVDGILLARDDAENHLAMALPFLEAGLPIYIDKPLALTCAEVERLFALQKYPGQIFTCSAFQYARELKFVSNDAAKKIIHIDAHIKNSWQKYAIHLIEPILKVIGHEHAIRQVNTIHNQHQKIANYIFENDLSIQIKTFQIANVKPTIHFFYEDKVESIVFADTFFAFKSALEKFVEGVRDKKEITQKAFVLRSMEMLERGMC